MGNWKNYTLKNYTLKNKEKHNGLKEREDGKNDLFSKNY